MVTQADKDTGVEVQRTICRTDGGHPRQDLQACPYCRAFYCHDCIKTHFCLKDLANLIQAKWPGYTVTYQWNSDDGLHVSIAKSHTDRILTVIEAEVLEDWSPRQILSRLEAANWLLALAGSKGRSVPHFTNKGFVFQPRPK